MAQKLALSDATLLETRGYIDGAWVSSDQTTPILNPATDELVAEVADLTRDDIKTAIEAAQNAQAGWAALSALERANFLMAWHDLMVAHADDLALIITSEMGKPLAESKGEVLYGASYVRWFAEEARRIYGDIISAPQADKRIMILKQPIGVVGAITPWNFPNAMIARKMAPALAAGCCFVGRPAEDTPLSALALCVLAERAGIPKGVLNIIPGSDYVGMGQELCENDTVKKLTFTGSTEVGRILMRQSAQSLKKLSLELGGNASFIVFEDADIDKAVEGAMASKYRNAGQTCVCANRIYVQRGVYQTFAEKLVEKTKALQIGNGLDAGVQVGPIINAEGMAKIERHLADATSKGAKILTGGTKLEGVGQFIEPAVLANVTSDMQIVHEETFGPVAPLIAFDEEDEVIKMANNTPYGLCSYFYTADLARSWRVAEALECGMVGVNAGIISAAEAPFGGVKASGLGREGSKYGLDEYLEIKYVSVQL